MKEMPCHCKKNCYSKKKKILQISVLIKMFRLKKYLYPVKCRLHKILALVLAFFHFKTKSKFVQKMHELLNEITCNSIFTLQQESFFLKVP